MLSFCIVTQFYAAANCYYRQYYALLLRDILSSYEYRLTPCISEPPSIHCTPCSYPVGAWACPAQANIHAWFWAGQAHAPTHYDPFEKREGANEPYVLE